MVGIDDIHEFSLSSFSLYVAQKGMSREVTIENYKPEYIYRMIPCYGFLLMTYQLTLNIRASSHLYN